MNLRPKIAEEPEVNLTSLIDVVLLLLVFFMVSTSFVREADLKVTLPEAALQATPAQQAPLEITITANGDYYVNGQALVSNQPKVLERAIDKVVEGQREVPVTIKADASTTHQSVVTVMDTAGRMGFVNITIVTSGDVAASGGGVQ
ncbi:MAG: biopolymer transporter ExbD [Gammaproteobacteria bacterium]|nr:biopolymer transporter ExbD [Gammaproteobacteria bacterium]